MTSEVFQNLVPEVLMVLREDNRSLEEIIGSEITYF